MRTPRRIHDYLLERSCRATLTRLDLPPQFRLRDLVARLEERRGRELWVRPNELLPVEITGMWLGTPDRDYVLYRASLDGCHREYTVLHELSHMMCTHRSVDVEDPQWLLDSCPWIGGLGVVEHVCLRSDHDSPDEREAEAMASLILAGQAGRQSLRRPSSAQEEQAQRLEAIFRT